MKYPWPLPPLARRCRWYNTGRDNTLTGGFYEGRCDVLLPQSNTLASVICIEDPICYHAFWGYGDYRGEPFEL